MIPTVFGFLVVAAALCLMAASITSMLSLVLVATLFGAASAIDLPALGGSNILPASLALVFLLLRVLLAPVGRFPIIAQAIQQNIFLVLYCLYGAVTAFFLPFIFSHTLNVPQLHVAHSNTDLFSTAPVQFSSQNITTAVYLIGTMLVSLAASITCRFERQYDKILRTITFITWLHIIFGILDITLSKFGLHDWLDIFRNASYSQVNQDIDGVQRVAGIFPETSAYSAYGFVFFVLNVELWLRGEKPRLTGATSFAMFVMLLFTTSTTAYLSIAIYGLLLLLRVLLTPMRLPFSKKLYLSCTAIVALTVLLSVAVFMPAMSKLILDIGQQMTFGKLQTDSGVQRLFWAHKGWEAFWASNWLGIGAGSFHSSGFLSAVAGSLGVFGLATLFLYVLTVLRPFRVQSHDVNVVGEQRLQIAFGWAAAIGMIPGFIGAPSADPGLLFGIFSGIAVLQTNSIRKVRWASRSFVKATATRLLSPNDSEDRAPRGASRY